MYRSEDHRTHSPSSESGIEMAGAQATDNWARVKRRLRAELGEDVFASWFARLELDAVVDGCAFLTVPTRFLKSWIESHYADRVLTLYRAEASDVGRVTIGVRSSGNVSGRDSALLRRAASEPPRTSSDTPSAPSGDLRMSAPALPEDRSESGELGGAPLDQRLTFDSFIVGRSNALAHAAADRVAGNGQAIYNPLYLHAGVGLGKTHLLHAIGHAARNQGRRVIYLTADRFMYGFVASLKAQTSLAFKERLRGIDLLILDDVQFIQGKQIQQEFGHTLNALIDAGRQIVVAADRPPADLESPGRARALPAGRRPRRGGRRPGRGPARLHPDDPVRGPEDHPSFLRGEPNVVSFVARSITANGRDLEGAVNRLLAHATLTSSAITIETAETAIRDLVRNREPKRVKIEDIQKLVASRYNVSRSDILSERRTAAVVRPRQIAMYLSKVLTLRSLPEIGRRFGGRDHTTVLHAVRKIEKAIHEDNALSDEVELLKRMLQE